MRKVRLMEPNEDYELRRVLRAWQVPDAPAELEDRLMAARRGPLAWQLIVGWRARLVLAAASVALVAAGLWLSGMPAELVRPAIASAPPLSFDTDGETPFVPVP